MIFRLSPIAHAHIVASDRSDWRSAPGCALYQMQSFIFVPPWEPSWECHVGAIVGMPLLLRQERD